MTDLYPNLFKNLTRNPITVVLLDGRKQMMIYDKTTKLETLFEETCSLCNLDCDNLFGFATLMDDYYAFLNLDTKVSKINFKEICRKSQNNILFKSSLTSYAPVHQVFEENRRLSQDNKFSRDNNKLMKSTTSTKSAPVYHLNDTLTPPQNNTPIIYFRIKSYVEIHCLRDKNTKSLYFLQLLRNVLDYKLKCADEIYLQLGALAIQAFYGDYASMLTVSVDDINSTASSNTDTSDYSHSPSLTKHSRISICSLNCTIEEVRSGKYFEPRKFFPSWIIDKYTPAYLFKEIPQLHKGLSGLSRQESEFSFIRMASTQYSNFNMHLFPVRDQKVCNSHKSFMPSTAVLGTIKRNGTTVIKNRLWLGLSPAGLEMHQMKQCDYIEHISLLKWSDIDEITHKSSRINIIVGCRGLKLYTNTKMQADHLFWLTRHMHIYQTKALLNAGCTVEALELADRQKYREKYVYMDLEDLKLHGLLNNDNVDCCDLATDTSSVVRLPLVCTPSAPPRRTPSKAKPLKMKDLVRMANSGNESNNGSPEGSFHTGKHSQYIKKSQPSSTHSSNYINKKIGSPDTPTRAKIKDSPCNSQSIDRTDSDQSTGLVTEITDDSDITESHSQSSSVFVIKPPGRFVSLSHEHCEDQALVSRISEVILPPPQQFRESVTSSHRHIVKSLSLHLRDTISGQSVISTHNVQLSRSVPLLVGLCHEFNNTEVIDDINSRDKRSYQHSFMHKCTNDILDKRNGTTMGMKSWKSEVMFNLSTCLDDDRIVSSYNDYCAGVRGFNDSRVTSLPRQIPGSYRDLISLSSLSSSLSLDSVEISSDSSLESKQIKYSRFTATRVAQIAII